MKASDLKADAFAILDNNSEFEAICLISEARIILSLGIPHYIRTPIMTWQDELGAFSRNDYLQTMKLFAMNQRRERVSN